MKPYCQLDRQLSGQGERGVSYTSKKDIPVKTPDGSPFDFFGFGYLKQRHLKRKLLKPAH